MTSTRPIPDPLSLGVAARSAAKSKVRRRLLAGLVPLLIAAGTLPLLAPTCGGGAEGTKTFSRSSLIIPMDRCYQYQTDGVTGTGQPAGCPQAADPGDVIKAYGLVYELIRNDVAVYWIIDQSKGSLTAYDLSIQYAGGFPVLNFDWATGAPGGPPTTTPDHLIRYMGGPFVVDGSDYAKASAVLQAYRTSFGAVNVHVSNVAFRGWVKKTMAGGWDAGGTVPPKLALLDIGSGNWTSSTNTCTNAGLSGPPCVRDPKNAEPVIQGYLTAAGIGTGTAGGTASGTHGEIYDRLTIQDFQPTAGSTDPRTSRLFTNGYQILWVPHWVAPGSCSNYADNGGHTKVWNCTNSLYSRSMIDQTLRTIGAFAADGKDVFAECAGLGSFEGAFRSGSNTSYTIDYEDGDPATRFQTTTGVRYNEIPNDPFPAPSYLGSFPSPLMQLGDFPFKPVTGAIEDYRPPDASYGAYHGDVTRLVAASGSYSNWDFFTLRPAGTGHGTIVYLGGHSYSGVQGTFQIAGSRLVLNTLFNLGAGCTESGVSCDTGLLGVCAKGVMKCSDSGQPVCTQTVQPSTEICNGLDDDCDGMVDEVLEAACYEGPASSLDGSGNPRGLCRKGVRACERQTNGTYAMGACAEQMLPSTELCNALDDDCDGLSDENLQQACYFGPLSTVDPDTGLPMGVCKPGLQTCATGNWGQCAGQVLPSEEVCPSALDENCDGWVNESTGEGCGSCSPGTQVQCYAGPGGTDGVGACHHGTQSCNTSNTWGPCLDQVVPHAEICGNGVDDDCDNGVDEDCGCTAAQDCYTCDEDSNTAAPSCVTRGVGTCRAGSQSCVAGEYVGACAGEVLPVPETCDGLDNNCNGTPDDGATCAGGFSCEHGVCVPSLCGVENICPEGYECSTGVSGDPDGTKCARATCGGAVCDDGKECQYGACIDPCQGVTCGDGSVCASGSCVGGSCYFTGCPDDQLCLQGQCVADPCDGVTCPGGTFCRQGDCVQACAFITCRSGEMCGTDGFCEPDPCANVTCGPTDRCLAGSCVDDPCLGVGCGQGQACQEGVCIDDPCTGVECPAGQCSGGQCYPVGNPNVVETPRTDGTSGGCGCGSGAASPLAALLLLLAVPLARRRRVGRGGGLALLLVAVSLLGSACKKSGEPGTVDLSSCEVTCEGEDRCIDVWTDPAHCGACGNVCGEGNVCVDKVCGPASTVAPYISGVSPDEASRGGSVQVEVTGQRFAAGATLRVVSPAGTSTYDTELVDASRLRVDVDLAEAAATTTYLRVVNPDKVISNAVRFDVTTPSPVIAEIDPASALTGKITVITVTGTGFIDGSRCHVTGPILAEQVIPSELATESTLKCTFDATAIAPGAGFQLWVVNAADPDPLESNKITFAVTSKDPVISDLSPNQGTSGEVVAFTVTGDGFDVTSAVLFAGSPVPTTFIDASQLYVAQLLLPTCGSCTREVSVRNGADPGPYKTSATSRTFYVGADPPMVTGLSPGSAYQGQTGVVLTFSGSSFPAGTQIQLQPPGGSFYTLAGSAVNGAFTAVTATAGFVTGAGWSGQPAPAGNWLARLAYPGGGTSASFSFRLLSNTAILQAASPRGEMQGDSVVPVTLTAVNLRPDPSPAPHYGIKVVFNAQDWTPTAVNAGTGTVTVNLSTVGANTGTYGLQLRNPNAVASNSLSFNVTPGPPTLSGLTPSAAPQQETPVTITLTGTNFAKPDGSGNGGSIVRVSAPELGVTDYPIPSTSTIVDSPTSMRVQFDTRTGPPGAYDVSVWNPGGPTPPQKSNVLPDAFRIQ